MASTDKSPAKSKKASILDKKTTPKQGSETKKKTPEYETKKKTPELDGKKKTPEFEGKKITRPGRLLDVEFQKQRLTGALPQVRAAPSSLAWPSPTRLLSPCGRFPPFLFIDTASR